MPRRNSEPPLIVFALDAGDADLIQQWTQDGSLPHLAAIMKQGCWGSISSEAIFSEFGQWTTLLGGIRRQRHGYYYFRQLVPGTYDLRPFSHLDTGALPFWAHLRGTGRKVAIIDAPECSMVPYLDGIQLSNWSARHLPQRDLLLSADPTELLQEARRVFGKQIRIVDFSPGKTAEQDLKILYRMLDRVERKGRLCRHLLSKNRYDLIVIGYYEAHDASHRFWDYYCAREGQQSVGAPELVHAIRRVYQAIDHELGLLLTSLPAETTIAVLSCYGMATAFPTTGLIDSFCHELGYRARRAKSASVGPLDCLRRLIPERWRVSISDHLPVRVQERLLADQFRNCTDWTKTQAFSIPSVHTTFVRVNMRNREPLGCVSSGKDYEAVLERLATDLTRVSDPVTGEPAVASVTRSMDMDGRVPPDRLPDLFVKWRDQPRFLDRLAHPHAEIRQNPTWFHRSSSHSDDGFFAAAGPTIAKLGPIGEVSILAFAPTLLGMMREAVPSEFSGELIFPFLSGADLPR